jgi:gliding motility associated protien GldN
MKSALVKICLLMVVFTVVVKESDAQRRGSRRSSTTPVNPTQQQTNNNTTAPKYNPYGNIPIVVDSSGSTYSDTVKKSLRQDAAFDKSAITERTPLPYEHLRWDDALYTERVWREIDLREKMNMPFRYQAQDDNGDQRFITILLKAVRSGEVTAFDAQDDRFTTPLNIEGVNKTMSGGVSDTVGVRDPNDPSKIIQYKVVQTSFNPDDIMKFRLKEEWVFDREASRMFVRILGIAPLKTIYLPDGVTERGSAPMFWVYYPDLRPTLAKYEVYNSKNMGTGRMTWEELFESRMFSSYIVRSTLDNPLNKNLKTYIKDPILALLEGDNIKDKIFNYEQDLWSY